jgi:predicted aspartyl protease
LVGHYVNVCP